MYIKIYVLHILHLYIIYILYITKHVIGIYIYIFLFIYLQHAPLLLVTLHA